MSIDGDATPAYFDPSDAAPKPIGDFANVDVVFDAQGAEKARRPHLVRRPSLNELHPVKVTKRMPLLEALMSFNFRQSMQLAHVDGLIFEFPRDLARDLQQNQEVALLGSGPKANQPLVIREHGGAWRGFLYGEVNAQGEYRLLLLLSIKNSNCRQQKRSTRMLDRAKLSLTGRYGIATGGAVTDPVLLSVATDFDH